MSQSKQSVLVTGIAGNLGVRLLRHASDFSILGVDLRPPAVADPPRFSSLDIGDERSCRELVRLLRESGARSVVHLAFVLDPLRTNVLDVGRMWQINVAGTARVMEAITEVNRSGGTIEKFVFISSVSAYGPELPGAVSEDHPLAGHTLPYAVHKREADEVVRARYADLGECRTYLLRPHIFTGATMQNYMVGALRGTPTGRGKWAERLRRRGKRLPIVLPYGERYLMNLYQFVHVDDVARLIAFILRRTENDPQLTLLNVAGRGEPMTFAQCLQATKARLVRLPGRAACGAALRLFWKMGISGVPPESLPYLLGTYTMNTSRLREFLGGDYEKVMRFTNREALLDSFARPSN